jgi:hypothetical protein
MLFGTDFDKIEFQIFGLNLVETNAFIGDFILGVFVIYLAIKIHRLNSEMPFFKNWKLFFVTLGTGFFLGGIGHSMFLYFGVYGKYSGWLLSIISVTYLEVAILSIHPSTEKGKLLLVISKIKMFVAISLEIGILVFVNLTNDPQRGLWVPLINSGIGFIFCLGYISHKYQKIITNSFRSLKIVLVLMFPAAIIQYFKISIYPWLDRNDIGHFLLAITFFMYWKAIKGYHNYLETDLNSKKS